jgi:trimeric autotransporter adhesin
MKNRTHFLVIALTSIFLAIMEPNAPAVVPPPDGGYPNFTTAEGQNALLHLSSGAANTAVGWFSLENVTTAGYNTGVGAGTLALNTADENTATGAGALLLNTTGGGNTANGALALLHNDTGQGNTAIGTDALLDNTIGNFCTATGFGALVHNTNNANTANGAFALQNNTSGFANTGIGGQALQSNQVGTNNTATGFQALLFNDGSNNTACGSQALLNNTSGFYNTATGVSALAQNANGSHNTANGFQALQNNTLADDNTATGFNALTNNTNGAGNTAVGTSALVFNSSGSNNTAIGFAAGSNRTTGDNNIDIGYSVAGMAGESNTIRIGNGNITGTYISGISGSTASGGAAVFVNSDGKLGTLTSSARFKDEIKPMGQASEAVLALKPVMFRYKKDLDPRGTQQFGLVAEDVEKVNCDLVVRDDKGHIHTVRYEAVNAMLLNEFLKEHRRVQNQTQKIQEQETTIAELKKQVQTIVAHSKEQDVKIQRVSDQIQIKSSPVVVTDR